MVKPVTTKGNNMKNIIIPKTKSSCFPEVSFPPKIPIAKYATAIAKAIQTIPKYFFNVFILLLLVVKCINFSVDIYHSDDKTNCGYAYRIP